MNKLIVYFFLLNLCLPNSNAYIYISSGRDIPPTSINLLYVKDFLYVITSTEISNNSKTERIIYDDRKVPPGAITTQFAPPTGLISRVENDAFLTKNNYNPILKSSNMIVNSSAYDDWHLYLDGVTFSCNQGEYNVGYYSIKTTDMFGENFIYSTGLEYNNKTKKKDKYTVLLENYIDDRCDGHSTDITVDIKDISNFPIHADTHNNYTVYSFIRDISHSNHYIVVSETGYTEDGNYWKVRDGFNNPSKTYMVNTGMDFNFIGMVACFDKVVIAGNDPITNKLHVYSVQLNDQNTDNNNNNNNINNSNSQTIPQIGTSKTTLLFTRDYKVTNYIKCENPTYILIYSNISKVLTVYNIISLEINDYSIDLGIDDNSYKLIGSYSRGGPPVNPTYFRNLENIENEKKKKKLMLSIVLPIVCVAFLILVVSFTVVIIKKRRRNNNNNNNNNPTTDKENKENNS